MNTWFLLYTPATSPGILGLSVEDANFSNLRSHSSILGNLLSFPATPLYLIHENCLLVMGLFNCLVPPPPLLTPLHIPQSGSCWREFGSFLPGTLAGPDLGDPQHTKLNASSPFPWPPLPFMFSQLHPNYFNGLPLKELGSLPPVSLSSPLPRSILLVMPD